METRHFYFIQIASLYSTILMNKQPVCWDHYTSRTFASLKSSESDASCQGIRSWNSTRLHRVIERHRRFSLPRIFRARARAWLFYRPVLFRVNAVDDSSATVAALCSGWYRRAATSREESSRAFRITGRIIATQGVEPSARIPPCFRRLCPPPWFSPRETSRS